MKSTYTYTRTTTDQEDRKMHIIDMIVTCVVLAPFAVLALYMAIF